jgi:hypothetical protein
MLDKVKGVSNLVDENAETPPSALLSAYNKTKNIKVDTLQKEHQKNKKKNKYDDDDDFMNV